MRGAAGVAVGAGRTSTGSSTRCTIDEQNLATQQIALSAAEVAERIATGHAAANRAVLVLGAAGRSCSALKTGASVLNVQKHSLQHKLLAATSALRMS